jgi:hypothetical protein
MNGVAISIQYKCDAFDNITDRTDIVRIQNIEYYINNLFDIFAWHKIVNVDVVNIVDMQNITKNNNIVNVSDTDIDNSISQYPAKKKNKIRQVIRWFRHLARTS